jgi:hypothetical protein
LHCGGILSGADVLPWTEKVAADGHDPFNDG